MWKGLWGANTDNVIPRAVNSCSPSISTSTTELLHSWLARSAVYSASWSAAQQSYLSGETHWKAFLLKINSVRRRPANHRYPCCLSARQPIPINPPKCSTYAENISRMCPGRELGDLNPPQRTLRHKEYIHKYVYIKGKQIVSPMTCRYLYKRTLHRVKGFNALWTFELGRDEKPPLGNNPI